MTDSELGARRVCRAFFIFKKIEKKVEKSLEVMKKIVPLQSRSENERVFYRKFFEKTDRSTSKYREQNRSRALISLKENKSAEIKLEL